jgi:hypothetical protein
MLDLMGIWIFRLPARKIEGFAIDIGRHPCFLSGFSPLLPASAGRGGRGVRKGIEIREGTSEDARRIMNPRSTQRARSFYIDMKRPREPLCPPWIKDALEPREPIR